MIAIEGREMGVSRRRCRHSGQPQEWARLRARTRAARQPPAGGELPVDAFLGLAAALFPDRAICAGPVLLHADDFFECDGPDCLGAAHAQHTPDVVRSCQEVPS